MILYNSCVGIMQSVGDSKHPLYFLIVSSCVNVILDIIFVAGLHMNVEGAGLGYNSIAVFKCCSLFVSIDSDK